MYTNTPCTHSPTLSLSLSLIHCKHTCMHCTLTQEGTATPTTASSEEDGISTVPSLSPPPPPAVELNMAPPLEKQFKKPPPMGNRRKPTKQYLQEKKGEEVTDLDGERVYVCMHMCVNVIFLPWPYTHRHMYIRTYVCMYAHTCKRLPTKRLLRVDLVTIEMCLRSQPEGIFPSPVHVVYKQNFILKPLDVRWTFATDLAKSHRICFAWVPQITNIDH